MKKRLVWLVECVHGYESGCSFGDCVGGTYEPIEIDYAAALESIRTMFYPNEYSDGYAAQCVESAVNAAIGGES